MVSHPEIQITTFQPQEWSLYRETRLKALADAPLAFCQSLSEAQQILDQEWQARLVCDRPDSLHLPIKALWEEEIGGMAWGRINKAEPQTAHLFQMWQELRIDSCMNVWVEIHRCCMNHSIAYSDQTFHGSLHD